MKGSALKNTGTSIHWTTTRSLSRNKHRFPRLALQPRRRFPSVSPYTRLRLCCSVHSRRVPPWLHNRSSKSIALSTTTQPHYARTETANKDCVWMDECILDDVGTSYCGPLDVELKKRICQLSAKVRHHKRRSKLTIGFLDQGGSLSEAMPPPIKQ
ncbi:hypothetical protein BDN71DRAFT_1456808 [Pleurotus eryngii]|uniref:Uncharacterized protein n=1 Tax=Pleurotus eryngii TaxID=5323 RepID=A0A9P5ZK61_PLEER|nr:hypothetical protein BDN71DRAFT_1456808 [Pleurotus eryngii]